MDVIDVIPSDRRNDDARPVPSRPRAVPARGAPDVVIRRRASVVAPLARDNRARGARSSSPARPSRAMSRDDDAALVRTPRRSFDTTKESTPTDAGKGADDRATSPMSALSAPSSARNSREGLARAGSEASEGAKLAWTATLIGDARASRRLTPRELRASGKEDGTWIASPFDEDDDRDDDATGSGRLSDASASSSQSGTFRSALGAVPEEWDADPDPLGMAKPEDVLNASTFGWRFRMEDFQLVNVIGRGRYSVVYKAYYRRMNFEVALKCYIKAKLKPHVYEQIAHEIAVHHSMRDTAIAGFYGSFIDTSTGNYYLIHELHNRGDAFNALARVGGKFSESRAVTGVMKSIIQAVAHMHAMNVIHRDIKPENVLLTDDGRAKLTDFGFALHLEWFKPLGRLGTTDYMAPEVVRCDKEFRERYLRLNRAGYGKAVDLWAIGALAFELVVGFPPFQSTSRQQAYDMILQGSFKIPAFVSEHGADFIRKCLVLDPSARLKPAEMLEHPWIVSLGSSGGPRANAPRSVLDFDASFMTKSAVSRAGDKTRAKQPVIQVCCGKHFARSARFDQGRIRLAVRGEQRRAHEQWTSRDDGEPICHGLCGFGGRGRA